MNRNFGLIPIENDEARRDALLARIDSIITKAEVEQRDFTPDEERVRKELMREVNAIQARADAKAGLLDIDALHASADASSYSDDIYRRFDPVGGSGFRASGRLQPGVAFARLVGAIAQSRGNIVAAAEFAGRWTDTPDVRRVLRAAVAAGSTTDPAWAGALVPYRQMQDEFIALLTPQ